MKILSVSDKVEKKVYTASAKQRYADTDLVLGCGDLPYYYLEFLVDTLNVPVFFVRGNHDHKVELNDYGERRAPCGAVDLHNRIIEHKGLLFGGFEGSVRYKPGPFQYSEFEMWRLVLFKLPRLWFNQLRYGRALDILVTHAPPVGINDKQDRVHRGFKALRWLIEKFKPAYHFHGHVHIYGYGSTETAETEHQGTMVLNAYGSRETVIDVEGVQRRFEE